MSAAPASGDQFKLQLIFAATYFMTGFATWLNGPLITFVRLAFRLDDIEAFLVPVAFYMSYLVAALPAAAVLRCTGMKLGMSLGLLVMAAGSVLFGVFTLRLQFPPALAGLFVIGAGLALLQTAGNPYIAIVGPPERAAQRIAVMGICNKFAGILAPVVFGVLVLRGIDGFEGQVAATPEGVARQALLATFAAKALLPYLAMAGVLALLALFVHLSPLPDIRAPEGETTGTGSTSIRDFPHLWLGALCIFIYVGIEVMATDAIGPYGRAFGLSLSITSYFTSATMGAMLVGYLVGALVVPRHVSQQHYLAGSAVAGLVLVVLAYVTTGYASVAMVALLGCANAMMWPAIIPLALRGLGRHTEVGSAIIVMSLCGGALIPQAFALLKAVLPFQTVFAVIMTLCYAYVLFYALVGAHWPSRKAESPAS